MEKTPPISNRSKKKNVTKLTLLAEEGIPRPLSLLTSSAATDDKLSLTSTTSSSNYQSLDSLMMLSASLDERDADNEKTTKRELLQRNNSGESNNCGNTGDVEDEVFSKVNPIARLRGNATNRNRQHANRTNNPLPPPPQQSIPLQQQQIPHHSETALITLLHEMRTLEQQLQQETTSHANEREDLLRQLTRTNKELTQLQHDNEALRRENASLKTKISAILAKLDNFATKCWRFNSASVKKMSEALHIQIHEWSAQLQSSYNIASVVTDSSSQDEEEAMRTNTMDKLQNMHLEIQNMKRENRKMRSKMKRYQNQLRMDDNTSDEISHMSGITQLTCATSITTGTTSTARLMDAMAGFLNEHEGKSGRYSPKMRKNKNTPTTTPSSSSSPPQSILKSTFKYDNNTSNEQQQGMLLPNPSLSEQPQRVLKAPKVSQVSNNTNLVSEGGSAITRSTHRSNQSNSSQRHPSTQKQVNFANFDNAQFENAEFQSPALSSENHRLNKTWGCEMREV